jgi:hypothetical protein
VITAGVKCLRGLGFGFAFAGPFMEGLEEGSTELENLQNLQEGLRKAEADEIICECLDQADEPDFAAVAAKIVALELDDDSLIASLGLQDLQGQQVTRLEALVQSLGKAFVAAYLAQEGEVDADAVADQIRILDLDDETLKACLEVPDLEGEKAERLDALKESLDVEA